MQYQKNIVTGNFWILYNVYKLISKSRLFIEMHAPKYVLICTT